MEKIMTHLTDQLSIRVDDQLKVNVVNGLKIPNKTTITAIEAGEHGEVTKTDIQGLKKMFDNL